MVAQDILAQSLKEHHKAGDIEDAVLRVAQEHGVSQYLVEALSCEEGYVPKKYLRNLGTVGEAGQAKLLRSKVLIVGLGGLGGYVVEQLARCGVGRLIGVDPDRFDSTNLNRQLFSDIESLGKEKARVAQARVARVNDAVEFLPCVCRVEDLDQEIYGGCHLIFDCLDNIATRLFLEQEAARQNIPLVHGAIAGWYGQIAVLNPTVGTLGKIYGSHRKGIEQQLGNPPFTPALIASLMVCEGIKVLLGHKNPDNILLYCDLLNHQYQRLEF